MFFFHYFNNTGPNSSVPNKRVDPNKRARAGWNFDKNEVTVQSRISVQGGILPKIRSIGRFIHNNKNFIYFLNV